MGRFYINIIPGKDMGSISDFTSVAVSSRSIGTFTHNVVYNQQTNISNICSTTFL